MKSRKTMKHQQLINEAIDQLKSRFNPRVQDVKRVLAFILDIRDAVLTCDMPGH